MELDFGVKHGQMLDLKQKKKEWASRVFAEPIQLAEEEKNKLPFSNIEDPAVEAVLYTNLHSRDSEVSLRLIGAQVSRFRQAIAAVRQAILRREHEVASARTRIEMMDRVNAAEPNPKLHYPPQVYEEILARIAVTAKECSYLRQHKPMLEALEKLLNIFDNASIRRSDEQLLRLFAQAYRGQLRIKAFEKQFPLELEPLLAESSFNGRTISLGDNRILLEGKTYSYLCHLLESIEIMLDLSASYLASQEVIEEKHWFPLFATLRAIVELFYICNFELPYFYDELMIDENQVYRFDKVMARWVPQEESQDTLQYSKRICIEAATLLAQKPELLECENADDVSKLLKGIELKDVPSDTERKSLRHYPTFGLVEFDFNPAAQRSKMQQAFSLVKLLIDQVVSCESSNFPLLSSGLAGSPCEELVALAEFDWRAFGLKSEPASLAGMQRNRLLSRFWRTVSRRRAISMLGENYNRKVTAAMEAIGEPGPENPTFLSIVLKPTMSNIAQARGEVLSDPLTGLMIADRLRLGEMLQITWKIAAQFLDCLKDVHSQGKLKRVIEGLPQSIKEHQEEIASRFNTKWLQSQSRVWSIIRALLPTVWDFWVKVREGTTWQDNLVKLQPLNALNLLVKLFCEVARMLLILEISGTVIEKLETDAEGAAQTILSSIHNYLEGTPMPAQLAEAINYYYDPEERFDAWLGFTSAFKLHLQQMLSDYRKINADKQLIEALSSLSSQLELLYPSTKKVTTAVLSVKKPSSVPTTEAIPITESAGLCFARVFFEILGLQESDTIMFLKLLSMLSRKSTEHFINCPESLHSLICELLPQQYQRLLLFGFPKATNSFLNYIRSMEDKHLDALRMRSLDYFTKLAAYADAAIEITSQLPTILSKDREVLNQFLTSTTTKGEVSYLFLIVCETLVIDICATTAERGHQLETATAKINSYIKTLKSSGEVPEVELFPIGGGRIVRESSSKIIVTGQNESFEITFTEPDKAMSNYLLSRICSIKASFISRVLHEEFPQTSFSVVF